MEWGAACLVPSLLFSVSSLFPFSSFTHICMHNISSGSSSGAVCMCVRVCVCVLGCTRQQQRAYVLIHSVSLHVLPQGNGTVTCLATTGRPPQAQARTQRQSASMVPLAEVLQSISLLPGEYVRLEDVLHHMINKLKSSCRRPHHEVALDHSPCLALCSLHMRLLPRYCEHTLHRHQPPCACVWEECETWSLPDMVCTFTEQGQLCMQTQAHTRPQVK
ncbi:hypothetical protein PTSG_12593 [Salpingoeca rosetta]|uniref:TAZ-type domain-containing protein n=1 Tax=Salpingoeca rosetta (strain ATCC 50818 / BSB-021) TaxID=946362 RepID=F2UIX6_SALR5|nr:uncharacterized protein PTSG_12593 [Salpingoeca rosetta]EGD77175.1 hypothetical protein PTSG_12593 [Salpingoeca rosetta]|eukprot:XP_004991014.1 hypothetical protein PTSG_12593 [Salpingoeca rosetta]